MNGGWTAVIVTAVASVGFMGLQVARLQNRRSSGRATARPGSGVESGLHGHSVKAGAEVFDGFSYRVGARFAGRSRVVVGADRVSFCGPRVPAGLYWFWIWAQALSMALVVPAVVLAVTASGWWLWLLPIALFLVSAVIMAVGAGMWPGLGEMPGLGDGRYPAVEHSVSEARDVTLGAGWANGGLRWVLLPYYKGIDKLAEDHTVSWFGPDESGREARYALHCYEPDRARRLYGLLAGDEATSVSDA